MRKLLIVVGVVGLAGIVVPLLVQAQGAAQPGAPRQPGQEVGEAREGDQQEDGEPKESDDPEEAGPMHVTIPTLPLIIARYSAFSLPSPSHVAGCRTCCC